MDRRLIMVVYQYLSAFIIAQRVTTLCRAGLRRLFLDMDGSTLPVGLRLLTSILKQVNTWSRRSDGTLNRALAGLVELKVPASPIPINGVSTKDIVIDSANNVWVRIFLPSQEATTVNSSTAKMPVIIYYHGGGFAILGANVICYDQFCRSVARKCRAVVISVNYRKAPEHPYPAPYEDSFKALQWLSLQSTIDQALPTDADLSNCFLMGDSAGGNIVHHMGCKCSTLDMRPVTIRGLILLQPFFGGEERTPAELKLENVPIISVEAADWHWTAFLPKGSNRDHPACNVLGPGAPDMSRFHLPPVLVVISSLDTLQDWQMRYAEKLLHMGKQLEVSIYHGGIHGFYLVPGTSISTRLICDVHNFILSLS